jgi:uncharacterized membrane protein
VIDNCPGQAPSFTGVIFPLIQQKCDSCHGPGGVEASIPFSSYERIYQRRQTIQQRVRDCLMPPADAGPAQLSADERTTLLTWLVCGAPQT